VSLLLVVALCLVASRQAAAAAPAPVRQQSDKEARQTEKARASVLKRGTGPKARVRLRLRDGGKLEGYVSESNADSFTVTNAETGHATRVEYRQVAEVKGRGHSTVRKVAIGLGATAVVAGVLAIVVWRNLPRGIGGGLY
jgi:hypothetical protein